MAISREEIKEIAKKIADQVEHELDLRGSSLLSTEGGISKVKLRELIDEVPDVDDPVAINYWREVNNYWVYLEGWIDSCLISTGFPPMERGEWDAKIDYMKDMTQITLAEKAKEYNLKLIKGGFVENEREFIQHLYGVTYGVYKKAEEEA